MIKPHGGKLVDGVLNPNKSREILSKKNEYTTLILNDEQLKDVKNIARGVYSPLKGFLGEDDFESVIKEMRLSSGLVWSIPIVLDISKDDYNRIRNKQKLLLVNKYNNIPVALLEDIEVYKYSKKILAENIFKTLDIRHPGVEDVFRMKEYLIGGKVFLLDGREELFKEYNFTPEKIRKIFQGRGWNKIVAFQTRNVPHRGHEFLQKEALKKVDGLFIQPVIGKKKLENFKDEYIISCYEAIIDKYYPKNKVVLGILPLKMRYAGPREAIFRALIGKNYGCSHFIVGRDRAGVGNYYKPFTAQDIFNNFKKEEIGIEILKFPEIVYDNRRKKHCFADECDEDDAIFFSITKLREDVKNKKKLPEYLIRPEVYNVLTNSKNPLADSMYEKKTYKNKKGFVLWFTGLSQSGKSTIADKVYEILKKDEYKVERLDGDIVRESLTRDLGFSKDDRDENIRRIGFVAKLLSRNSVGVIASFVSPYIKQRNDLRLKIDNFIEIYTNTPLEVCEKRDKKGLYKKARNGEIKNFTGISDPYEIPENPEIELKPAEESMEKCADKVVDYLKNNKFI